MKNQKVRKAIIPYLEDEHAFYQLLRPWPKKCCQSVPQTNYSIYR